MVNKKKIIPLKQCMTRRQRDSLGDLPTTHQNCIEFTGVARPGKTKRDRLKREA